MGPLQYTLLIAELSLAPCHASWVVLSFSTYNPWMCLLGSYGVCVCHSWSQGQSLNTICSSFLALQLDRLLIVFVPQEMASWRRFQCLALHTCWHDPFFFPSLSLAMSPTFFLCVCTEMRMDFVLFKKCHRVLKLVLHYALISGFTVQIDCLGTLQILM